MKRGRIDVLACISCGELVRPGEDCGRSWCTCPHCGHVPERCVTVHLDAAVLMDSQRETVEAWLRKEPVKGAKLDTARRRLLKIARAKWGRSDAR